MLGTGKGIGEARVRGLGEQNETCDRECCEWAGCEEDSDIEHPGCTKEEPVQCPVHCKLVCCDNVYSVELRCERREQPSAGNPFNRCRS